MFHGFVLMIFLWIKAKQMIIDQTVSIQQRTIRNPWKSFGQSTNN